ncbi:hypothetical protein Pelo_19154 [Pelomyxa schiedti]|nr:hypothetical protein Pelo_19154 [Pelomyxa schiedti]
MVAWHLTSRTSLNVIASHHLTTSGGLLCSSCVAWIVKHNRCCANEPPSTQPEIVNITCLKWIIWQFGWRESTKTLDLSHLNLESVPEQIAGITCQKLDLSDNPILNLPPWLFQANICNVLLDDQKIPEPRSMEAPFPEIQQPFKMHKKSEKHLDSMELGIRRTNYWTSIFPMLRQQQVCFHTKVMSQTVAEQVMPVISVLKEIPKHDNVVNYTRELGATH